MASLSSQHPLLKLIESLPQTPYEFRVRDWVVLLFAASAAVAYLGDGKFWGKKDPNLYLMYTAPQASSEFKTKPKKTRNIAQKLEETDNDIVIFWGSQSGVTERFAKRLSREWHSRFALKTMLAEMDEYDPEHLAALPKGKFAVFMTSTYGEGDPPDNVVDFWNGLAKMKKNGVKLDGLRYLAMGLGNKNYKHYNQTIKSMDETLSALGACRIGPIGMADESQGTTEESFMDWKEAILEGLGGIVTLIEHPITYEPTIEISEACVDEEDIYMGELSEKQLHGQTGRVAYNEKNPYAAPIATSRIISSVSNRNCVHMEFNLSEVPALRYQTGDHLAVWPVNPENEVERLFRLLDLDELERTKPIKIESKDTAASTLSLPSPTTKEALLKYYLEICALASRDFLVMLAQYAPTPSAKEKLLRFGQEKEAFRTEIAANCLSIGKVMERVEPEAKWTNVPFSIFVESFGRLQARKYSISSSPLVQPRQPAITAIANNRQLGLQKNAKQETTQFMGLTSNFLLAHERSYKGADKASESQQPQSLLKYDLNGPRDKLANGKVFIHIKRSTFKLPLNPMIPIVMIGAGTGIAPFRGFVQERARIAELGKPIGKMLLFFGCRSEGADFLYCEEWDHWKRKLGENLEVITAFSREPSQEKFYVQQRVRQEGEKVGQILDDRGVVYICGAAAMAREVRQELVSILAKRKGMAPEEVDEKVMTKMKKSGLYQEDVWG